jgi:prepilin-type N-terminal cleavage/methylation domain-containing protein
MGSAVSTSSERGFSLVEVVLATALMAILAIGVAQLFAIGAFANLRAKNQTSLTMLAVQKMEQLKALQWGFDQQPNSLGLPASDVVTDLSQCRWSSPAAHCAGRTDSSGGAGHGLNPSPENTLETNTIGYTDYLDRNGQWMGNGTSFPAGAHYVRRWAIHPLPTNPNNTLVFQVRVLTRDMAASPLLARHAGVTIVGVKSRKAP